MRVTTRTSRNRSWLRIWIALALLLIVMVPVAVNAAGGRFTDDDNSVFEGDIEWMAASGVTFGCNPPGNDHYCPDDLVDRGQMAAFMHRLAVNQVVDAATAVTADTAKDAETLDGHAPSDFATSTHTHDTPAPSNYGLSVYYNGSLEVVGENFWETSLELEDVPSGSYFIIAEATFTTDEIMTVARPQCQLVAGTQSDFTATAIDPTYMAPFTLTVAATFDTNGNTVRLDCRDWGEMVSMNYPRMTAITLGGLVNSQVIDSG